MSFVHLFWSGDRIEREIEAGLVDGLYLAAGWLEDESNGLVPVDSTELRESSYVDVDAEALSASVSYSTPYAVLRHESGFAHLRNGRKKFLEIPFVQGRREMLTLIRDAVRQRF